MAQNGVPVEVHNEMMAQTTAYEMGSLKELMDWNLPGIPLAVHMLSNGKYGRDGLGMETATKTQQLLGKTDKEFISSINARTREQGVGIVGIIDQESDSEEES